MRSVFRPIAKFLKYRVMRASVPHPAPSLLACVDPGLLAPKSTLLRLGTAYGGWIIPAESGLNGNSLCYLAGAGEDISFDCSLVRRFGCYVRILDPTPRAIEHFRQLSEAVRAGARFPINNSATDFYEITAEQLSHLSYLPVGLADVDAELKFFHPRDPAHVSCSVVNLQKTEEYFTAQCHRLKTVMERQGDTHIDLLKMDIEGAEYAVIRDLVESKILPRLLLIEFDEIHSPLDNGAEDRIRDHIRMLRDAGIRCIAIEGSNMTLMRDIGTTGHPN